MDSSRVFYAYGEETAFGVPPNSAQYKKIRYTGGSGWTIADTLTDSGEVRADLMRARPYVTQYAVDGGLDFEFSHSAQFHDWLAMGFSANGANLAACWSTAAVTAAGTVTVATVGGFWQFQAVSPGFAAINTAVPGQYIVTTGFTNPALNGAHRIKSVDFAADPQVIVVESTLAAETGSGDERIALSSMLRNGTTLHSVTVIDGRPGVGTYQAFMGQVCDSISMATQPNALVTGSVGFIGAGYSKSAVDITDPANTLGKVTRNFGVDDVPTAITGSTYTAAPSTPVFTTTSNVVIHENGTAVTSQKGFDWTLSGRGRARTELGTAYNAGVGLNTLYPELNLSYYFSNKTYLDKFTDQATSSTKVERNSMMDPEGNIYVFTFPSVTLSGFSLTAGSLDADMEVSFGSSKCSDYTDVAGASYAIQVDRIAGNVFA